MNNLNGRFEDVLSVCNFPKTSLNHSAKIASSGLGRKAKTAEWAKLRDEWIKLGGEVNWGI